MHGADRELGWEDVGGSLGGMETAGAAIGGAMTSAAMGQMGEGGGEGAISDAVTSAMMNHLAREISKGSMSLWPQFMAAARQYFNVTHGYVLKKMLWQLVPLTSAKKKGGEGELGGEKDWTVRVFQGLEVDIEEPDLYIPTMGFVTYVLLCGLIRGFEGQFKPEVLSATINYALVLCIVEACICKGVLFAAGAQNAPAVDLATMLAYKFFYLSAQLMVGLLLGWGYKPQGFIWCVISLALFVSCSIALWQALRRLPRMQPSMGQECVTDLHKLLIKAIPVLQALVLWALIPHWPGPRPVSVVKQAAAAVTALQTTVAASAAPVAAAAAAATNATAAM